MSDVLWNGDRVVGVKLADGRSAHAEVVVGAGSQLGCCEQGDARAGARNPAVSSPVLPLRHRLLGPDGSKPDAAEFSQLDDEIAYIFPSDAGLTCVAVSVNLETFRCTCALRRRPKQTRRLTVRYVPVLLEEKG